MGLTSDLAFKLVIRSRRLIALLAILESLWILLFLLEDALGGQFTVFPLQPVTPAFLLPALEIVSALSLLLLIGAMYSWNGSPLANKIVGIMSAGVAIGLGAIAEAGTSSQYNYQIYPGIVLAVGVFFGSIYISKVRAQ